MRLKLGKENISWGIVALVLKHHVVIMQTCSVLHCKIRHKPLNKRGDTKTWAPLCYHCGNNLLLLNCSCWSKIWKSTAATVPRDWGISKRFVDLSIHEHALFMYPSVTGVTLDSFLICFNWTRAHPAGILTVTRARIKFKVTWKDQESW